MGINTLGNSFLPVSWTSYPTYAAPSQNAAYQAAPQDLYVGAGDEQEWRPYKPTMMAKKAADDVIQTDTTEFYFKKPASNSAYDVRSTIMKRLGFTDADIRAYDADYPTNKGDKRPQYDGFYIYGHDKNAWATEDDIKNWKTDPRGNMSVPVKPSAVEGLKKFLQPRMDARFGDAFAGVADPALRQRLQADAKTLLTGNVPEDRMAAFQRLSAEGNPALGAAMDKLSSGYGDNAWLKMLQAQRADKEPGKLIGPGLEEQNRPAAQKLVDQALDLNTNMSPAESALFFRQAAHIYHQTGDPKSERQCTMQARYAEFPAEELGRFERIQDPFQRGLISATQPGRTDVPSVGNLSDDRRELQELSQKMRGDTPANTAEASGSPTVATYPGLTRDNNRHNAIGAAASVIDLWNTWGSLPGKMRDADARIQRLNELEQKVKNEDYYPVPPKPEELATLRPQIEAQLGKERAEQLLRNMAGASHAFWKR